MMIVVYVVVMAIMITVIPVMMIHPMIALRIVRVHGAVI